jgi:hypothetical protein
MRLLERRHPPDQLGGLFGTGRSRVHQLCRSFGISLSVIRQEQALRQSLTELRPVMLILGVSSGRFWDWFDLPGGHWVVAYGFDHGHIYLTNCGRMPWAEFRRSWSGLVPRLVRMGNIGLACTRLPTLAANVERP